MSPNELDQGIDLVHWGVGQIDPEQVYIQVIKAFDNPLVEGRRAQCAK